MATTLHLYRRGDRYWYRNTFRIAEKRRVEVRVSLRTSSLFVARKLAAILDAVSVEIGLQEVLVFGLLRRNDTGSIPAPTDADFKPALKSYFDGVLTQCLGHYSDYGGPDWHRHNHIQSTTNFDVHELVLSSGTTRSSVNRFAVTECIEGWRRSGRCSERISRAVEAFNSRYQPNAVFPIPLVERDRLVEQMGRQFSREDLERLDRLTCGAHLEANWRVERRRQSVSANLYETEDVPDGFPDAERPYSLDPLLRDVLISEPVAALAAPAEAKPIAEVPPANGPMVDTVINPQITNVKAASENESAAHPGAAQPVVSEQIQTAVIEVPVSGHVATWGALVEAFIASKRGQGTAFKSEAQVRTVSKIMEYVLGGLETPVTNVTQYQLGKFVDTMRSLPSRWGRTADELENGIEGSLRRANLPGVEVGVSAKTEAKHLTYLKQLISFGRRRGLGLPADLDVKALLEEKAIELRKEKRVRGRENWTPDDFRRLLGGAPFSGCKGHKRSERYLDGPCFFHDSAYFMPLFLGLMGGRSAEIGGAETADVVLDAPIPYLRLISRPERTLKNDASERDVPLHPELLRLGFLEYVEARRSAGDRYLFPELEPTTSTATWATNYYKSFILLRRRVFPEGTHSKTSLRGAAWENDVHSIRGMVITILASKANARVVEDIVGHENLHDAAGGTGVERANLQTKRYRDRSTLEDRLQALSHLSFLTEDLLPRPINLPPKRK